MSSIVEFIATNRGAIVWIIPLICLPLGFLLVAKAKSGASELGWMLLFSGLAMSIFYGVIYPN